LAGAQTGGSPITSYYVQFDSGTNGAVWTEIQGLTTFTTNLVMTVTGLQTAKIYQFRYMARNIFGWSAWSSVGYIKTITVPG